MKAFERVESQVFLSTFLEVFEYYGSGHTLSLEICPVVSQYCAGVNVIHGNFI